MHAKGYRLSSNSVAIGAPSERPETAAFVDEQLSRPALLLVVQGERGYSAAGALAAS